LKVFEGFLPGDESMPGFQEQKFKIYKLKFKRGEGDDGEFYFERVGEI